MNSPQKTQKGEIMDGFFILAVENTDSQYPDHNHLGCRQTIDQAITVARNYAKEHEHPIHLIYINEWQDDECVRSLNTEEWEWILEDAETLQEVA
jgi:hypothetical protein